MAFKLKQLDGEFGEVVSGITSKKPMVLFRERDEDYQIWIEPDFLNLVDYGVNIFSATYCVYDPDTKMYEDDHEVIYIFDADTGRMIYSECGSSLKVCIINFFRDMEIEVDDVDDVLCFYFLDNGKFIREKALKNAK